MSPNDLIVGEIYICKPDGSGSNSLSTDVDDSKFIYSGSSGGAMYPYKMLGGDGDWIPFSEEEIINWFHPID